MQSYRIITIIKTGLVLFWSLWLTIVFLTNLFEGLQYLRVIPESWKFISQNYAMIPKTVAIYDSPPWLAGLFFLGVLAWQGLALVLLWVAYEQMVSSGMAALPWVDAAFAALLALFGAFMIADEIFRAYDHQAGHMQIFIAQLVTLLAVHQL